MAPRQQTPHEVIASIFHTLSLPTPPPYNLNLTFGRLPLASSYNLTTLISSTTLLSAILPSLILAQRNNIDPPRVKVDRYHAAAQYLSERLYVTADPLPPSPPAIGGLHQTKDGGHIRMHDSFPHHRNGALKLLGLDESATRDDVAAACLQQPSALALEEAAHKAGLPIYALRTPAEWAAHPQSAATSSDPIILKPIATSETPTPYTLPPVSSPYHCLSGLRVLELSRVIAAPSAGKHLASHGADILWVTSPNLPNLPALDIEFARGKGSIQLDLSGNTPEDTDTFRALIKDCDVFLQGYRPGSLAAKGFSPEELVKINPNIICANLSAWGNDGPWANLRGFDSLVQTCTGMNVSEASFSPQGVPALPLPCQALDHASGHLLATGICAAVYHRSLKGGAWQVDVSLAATQKWLEGMGRVEVGGFDCASVTGPESFPIEMFEVGETAENGMMRYVNAAAKIDGAVVGWEYMPGKLGQDEPVWEERGW